MQRQQIQDRDIFTDEDRIHIAAKSHGYCAHCGKRIEFFGGQATIDHFVPLSKGGVNMDYNTVMLCYDCNQDKGNDIVSPGGYLSFLDKEHLKKLERYYYDSYIKAFEFFSPNHILAADRFYIQCFNAPSTIPVKIKKTKHKKSFGLVGFQLMIKRADPKTDKDKVMKFWQDYCKKHNITDAEYNMLFYLTAGTVYYIEQQGDIKMIFSLLFSQVTHDMSGLLIFIHSMYGHDRYLTIARNTLSTIIALFLSEQGLTTSPIVVTMRQEDSLISIFKERHFAPHSSSDGYISCYYFAARAHNADWNVRAETSKGITFAEKFIIPEQDLDDFVKQYPQAAPLKDFVYRDIYFTPPT